MADATKVEEQEPQDVKDKNPVDVNDKEVADAQEDNENKTEETAADGEATETGKSEVTGDVKEDGNKEGADDKTASITRPPKNMLRVRRIDDDGLARKNLFDPASRGDSSNHEEIRTQVCWHSCSPAPASHGRQCL
jgi:hypothetical protein